MIILDAKISLTNLYMPTRDLLPKDWGLEWAYTGMELTKNTMQNSSPAAISTANKNSQPASW